MKKIINLHQDGTLTTEEISNEINSDFLASLLLDETKSVVIKHFSKSWATENSVVTSIPILDLNKVFPEKKLHLVTASVVEINGPLPKEEESHYHTSHVIGMPFEGRAGLIGKIGGGEVSMGVGDLVVIPAGAFHFFTTKQGETMKWIGMEVSAQPIDYQKHFIDSERNGLED